MDNDENNKPLHQKNMSVPFYEELHAFNPPGMSASEASTLYASYLKNLPGYPWIREVDPNDFKPPMAAPSLTGADAATLSIEQLVNGVHIIIPRSARIRAGDHMRLRWGRNTYYTTIARSPRRTGPRLVHFISTERLADYQSGTVEVSYEIFRQANLVGTSEPLSVTLQAEGLNHYKRAGRIHTRRQRKQRD